VASIRHHENNIEINIRRHHRRINESGIEGVAAAWRKRSGMKKK